METISEIITSALKDNFEYLQDRRHFPLLDAGAFCRWLRDRGVSASGHHWEDSDATFFWSKGLMQADALYYASRTEITEPEPEPKNPYAYCLCEDHWAKGENESIALLFHPFRIHVFHSLLVPGLDIGRSSLLYRTRQVNLDFLSIDLTAKLQEDQYRESIFWKNSISGLAILCEPIYGGQVTENTSNIATEDDPAQTMYKQALHTLIRAIGSPAIEHMHLDLRTYAALMDNNSELYLLLRAARWKTREALSGKLSGALWLRHMGEVISRAHFEVFGNHLPSEDRAFGTWFAGARKWLYGSDLPIEDLKACSQKIVDRWHVGGHTRVRVYLEGDTEAGCITSYFGTRTPDHIELVHMAERGWNRLHDELRKDIAARRLSVIFVDRDREDYLRNVKNAVKNGLVVGMVFASDPDFEMNFTADELCKAAESIEQQDGDLLPPLDRGAFADIKSGKDFSERYRKIRNTTGTKGESFGAALVDVAFQSRASEYDESHFLVHALQSLARATTTDYEVQKEVSPIDPDTLKNLDARKGFPGRLHQTD